MSPAPSELPPIRARPGTVRAIVALLVALLPLALTTDIASAHGGLALFAPLAQLPHTDWVLFVLLLFASAPRRRRDEERVGPEPNDPEPNDPEPNDPVQAAPEQADVRRTDVRRPRFVPTVSLALFVPLALVHRDAISADWSDLWRPLVALAVAVASERAAATVRPSTWILVWWALFAAPIFVGVSFGWAQAHDAPVIALSPLALAAGDAWFGAAIGLAAALGASVFARDEPSVVPSGPSAALGEGRS